MQQRGSLVRSQPHPERRAQVLKPPLYLMQELEQGICLFNGSVLPWPQHWLRLVSKLGESQGSVHTSFALLSTACPTTPPSLSKLSRCSTLGSSHRPAALP